jgi:hypothetical protein
VQTLHRTRLRLSLVEPSRISSWKNGSGRGLEYPAISLAATLAGASSGRGAIPHRRYAWFVRRARERLQFARSADLVRCQSRR